MSLFSCNNPSVPPSSQPTIPVILRGKRRQHNRSQLQQPRNLSPYRPKIIRNNDIIRQSQQQHSYIVQKPQNRQQKYFRSVSTQKRVVVHNQHNPNSYMQRFIEQRPPITINNFPNPNQKKRQKLNINRQVKANENQKGRNQIRKSLDQKLNKAYNQLKKLKVLTNFPNSQLFNIVDPQNINIQKGLIQEYIKQVYEDYNIPDPLAENHKRYNQTIPYRHTYGNLIYESASTEPNKNSDGSQRKAQGMMHGSTNKKAIQLKQSFIIEMFSPANNSKQDSNKQQNTFSENYSGSHSNKKKESKHNILVSNPFVQPEQLAEITQVNERQIKQLFRFCFVCQQPILQANINVHQHERCPQFSHLYNLNLNQIRQSLIRKILRIKKQTEQIHELMFGNQNSMNLKLNSLKRQAKKYLESIDTNIEANMNDKIKRSQLSFYNQEVKQNFCSVMKCYEQNYLNLYENTRKLHWFLSMLKNLQNKYYNKNEIKNEGHSPFRRLSKATRQTDLFQSRRFSVAK